MRAGQRGRLNLVHSAPSVAVSALRNLIKQTTRELIASGDWPAAQADD